MTLAFAPTQPPSIATPVRRRNCATSPWTKERDEALKDLWLVGKSCKQIAEMLGDGITRNAVIGRVHRLGIAGRVAIPGYGRSSPATPLRVKPARTNLGHEPTRGQTSKGFVLKAPGQGTKTAPLEIKAAEPVPDSKMKALVELEHGDCRFPIGDPFEESFRFCAAPWQGDGPYCRIHHVLTHERRT